MNQETNQNHFSLLVQDLSQSYNHKKTLNKINLVIDGPQIITLLGANGAGKTTLLKVLAGLLHPLSGTYKFGAGHKGTSLFLPDGFLYEDFSLIENLRLYAKLSHTNDTWFYETLQRLDVEKFLEMKVRNLSRGQKIRGALCRAFLVDASLYLLDEPITGLDTASTAHFLEVIKLLKEQGKTILLSTHQPEKLLSLSDRWLQMDQGKLSETKQ